MAEPTRSSPGYGLILAVVGGVLGVIAFTAMDWFKRPQHFSDVRDSVQAAHDGHFDTAVGSLYFTWLGWAVLAAAVVIAILATVPSSVNLGVRALGALLGLAGITLTFWAIKYFHGPPYTAFLEHARAGFYVTLGAFLLTTFASLLGARQQD
jgi:hypothetical protein